ncbi:MAG: hypothetical protein H6721_00955 [Sandaracinus sp.]|nr:hypothetical protein [Sandaracinus sp.]MCB9630712.1 hypothetical protein [Sandaracinus sp.]
MLIDEPVRVASAARGARLAATGLLVVGSVGVGQSWLVDELGGLRFVVGLVAWVTFVSLLRCVGELARQLGAGDQAELAR